MEIIGLTCTGDRPVCLNLLEKWMNNQTRKLDKWYVIDDGQKESVPIDWTIHLRRKPMKTDPKHTLNANIKFALSHIKEEGVLLFIEDDEYYAPQYVETMTQRMISKPFTGIIRSRYYHLPSMSYFVHNTTNHASLAQTMIPTSYFKRLELLLPGSPFVDLRIWEDAQKNYRDQCLLFHDSPKAIYVGMKGMPGRTGIGSGHSGKFGRHDREFSKLKEWMPSDHVYYERILQNGGR